MSRNTRLIIIDIPNNWVPGRDSFVKLQLKPCKLYQFEHLLGFAEVAASVVVWYAQRKSGFEPISYRDLHMLNSPRVEVINPEGESYQATRLMAGIKVLMELDLVENDKKNKQIVIKEDLLDVICVTSTSSFFEPCA